MKAIQLGQYGGPDVLQIVDVPEPHPEAGQVHIKVRAAGVNQIDWKIRAGEVQDTFKLSLPSGTGVDVAGVVDEFGRARY